eukprot:COSAG02_NODE_9473_length_2205_cov_2.125831_6_plen_44_part_01
MATYSKSSSRVSCLPNLSMWLAPAAVIIVIFLSANFVVLVLCAE